MPAAATTPADTTARRQGGPRAVLWTMSALALVVAAVSALNVALPDLATDLGATSTELLWISNAYALVFAGLLIRQRDRPRGHGPSRRRAERARARVGGRAWSFPRTGSTATWRPASTSSWTAT